MFQTSLLLFLYGMILVISQLLIVLAIEKRKGYSFAVKKQPMVSNTLAIIYSLSVLIVSFILSVQ